MSFMKSPAFQFYAAEWISDEHVSMMSLEEEGCYIRLLAYCWREGSISSDVQALSRLCKGASTTLLTVVLKRFKQSATDASRLVHTRLDLEREKQAAWREKSAKGGRKSGKARAAKSRQVKRLEGAMKGGSTKDEASRLNQSPTLQSSSSSLSSSSSTSTTTEKKKDKRADKPHDPRSKHPAIVAVQNVRGSYPPKELWDTVIELLGEHPDVVRMKQSWVAWRTRDYKPTNYGWLIDWYVNGIPEGGNGHGLSRVDQSIAAARRVVAKYEQQG